jgi:hypothetical protein
MNMNKQQALPELPESQASGQIREIYDDIKHFSAVPMVALIYRHMATLPGVLEWAWEVLRPLMASGLLQEKGWQLARTAELPQALAISLAARQAAGISAADEAIIATSLAAFNRTNPINILSLRCLERHLRGAVATGDRMPPQAWTPPAALPPLPAMLDPNDMHPAARDIVDWLSHRGQGRYAGIWPSLYRYLAHVPPYLGFAAVILPPHFDGIDRAVTRLNAEIEKAAGELAALAPAPKLAAPVADARDKLERAIGNFTLLIPEMLVIGTLLERATPADNRDR